MINGSIIKATSKKSASASLMIFLEKKIIPGLFFPPNTDFNRVFSTPRKLRENEKLSDAFNHLSIAVKRSENEALGRDKRNDSFCLTCQR